MGEVHLAYDRYTRATVAVKLSTRQGERASHRFRREGLIASGFDHPGLVKILASGAHRGRPYLVYALVPGACSLEFVFPHAKPRRRIEILRDVSLALGHVHRCGVVHRDVKPANILLDVAGQVHLCDFGLAYSGDLPSLLPRTVAVGTPAFMSPEQASGKTPTPAADVWSVGVLLYEALTDELPFDGDTWRELRNDIILADPYRPREINPDAPPALEVICMKALRSDPRHRYRDGNAMARDLSRYLHGGLPRAWLGLWAHLS